MKKILFLLILLFLLSLALIACGGTSTTEETAGVEILGTPMPGGGLSDSMRLVLGILSLADSDIPLTTEQATAMLPLWKAVRSLGESDTAAQAELDALYTQIRGTLTAEQLDAIDTMSLDMQSMASLAEKWGLDMGFAAGFGSGMRGTASPELQATRQAMRESGQMPQFDENFTPPEGMDFPEGAPRLEFRSGGDAPSGGVVIEGGPDGGGGMQFFGGDGSGLTPEQMATAQASGVVNLPALRNTISGPWLEVLISQLESIASGE